MAFIVQGEHTISPETKCRLGLCGFGYEPSSPEKYALRESGESFVRIVQRNLQDVVQYYRYPNADAILRVPIAPRSRPLRHL